MKKVIVKQDPEKEVPVEILADAIVAISVSVKKLTSGRLSDRTLYMLIADAAPTYSQRPAIKVGIRDVKAVLEGIASLEKTHLKKLPQK